MFSKNMNSNDAQLFAILSILAGCFVAIFWMVVGWRAMKAHEKIAEALSVDLEQKAQLIRSSLRKDRIRDEKSFRDFLEADPLAKHLDANEQIRRFTEWKATQK
jgi:hypothetical protein